MLDATFRKIELPRRQASCRHSTRDCLMFALVMFKMEWPSLLATERNLQALSAEAGNLERLCGITRLDGHHLMPIDGTRTYQSKCKSCSRCLRTHHGDVSITYSHSELVAVLAAMEHQSVRPLLDSLYAAAPVVRQLREVDNNFLITAKKSARASFV